MEIQDQLDVISSQMKGINSKVNKVLEAMVGDGFGNGGCVNNHKAENTEMKTKIELNTNFRKSFGKISYTLVFMVIGAVVSCSVSLFFALKVLGKS